MTMADGLKAVLLDPTIYSIFLAEPPGWTRLEPQSVSGDPTPGLEARVHDPFWMLARQWQLGEFDGEDVGSPAFVTIDTTTAPVVAFQAGDPSAEQPVRAWHAADQLEPMVEREPTPTHGSGFRIRAEAGAQLLAELRAVGVDEMSIAHVLDACPLELPAPGDWDDPFDTTALQLSSFLAGRVPDAETAALAIRDALAAPAPALPSWLEGAADPDSVRQALANWFVWFRGSVSPVRDPANDSWVDNRLEHRFSLGIAANDGQHVLRAPSYTGGRAEWHDFDFDATASPLQAPGTSEQVTSRSTTVWASPLRYGGMPADRYWEYEDGMVNLGALQVQPHDIARLALVEFAMVYGSDWIALPLDVPYGSLIAVDSVRCMNTFGEEIGVPEIDDSGRSGRFRLFEISRSDGDETLNGLFVPPAAPTVFTGTFVEEVLYVRDEMANMAWAVERVVQGPSGDPRSRLDEPRPAPFQPGTDPGADMDYWLENEVPDWWIPFLPVSTGFATIALRKGAMVKHGARVQPRGVLLKPHEGVTLPDEEIPREGLRVRRVPALSRQANGLYARWISRRTFVGRGEGASGLEFDSAVRRKPEAP